MKIALLGYGKMNQQVEMLAKKQGYEIVAKISRSIKEEAHIQQADVFIDFSHSNSVLNHVEKACHYKKPIIIGTTGWLEQNEKINTLIRQAEIGAVIAPNFSIGIFLFNKMLSSAAELMNFFPEYDVAAVEYHHRNKADAPSGTAKLLANTILNKIQRKKYIENNPLPSSYEALHFSSIRCGHIPGTHSIIFDSVCDTISLEHRAHGRDSFALGALACANWLKDKKGIYTFEDFMEAMVKK